MVADAFLIGVLFGFVPAMGLLYVLLSKYQAFFDEKRVFKTFLFGLGLGLIVTLLELVLGSPSRPDATSSVAQAWGRILLYALLFGLLEAVAAAAVLNWRSYRGRGDTPFYAAALGLGFGAVATVFLVGLRVAVVEEVFAGWQALYVTLLLGLYFIGSILMHAGAFVWIGIGSARGGLVVAIGKTTLALGAYAAIFLALPHVDALLANVLTIGAMVVAIGFISYILSTQLDRVVPDEVLREAGIHRRRIARRTMAAGASSHEAVATGPGLEKDAALKEPPE